MRTESTKFRALQPIHTNVIISNFIRVNKDRDKHRAPSSYRLLEFSIRDRKNAEFAVL